MRYRVDSRRRHRVSTSTLLSDARRLRRQRFGRCLRLCAVAQYAQFDDQPDGRRQQKRHRRQRRLRQCGEATSVVSFATLQVLAGDYNLNGEVDAGDYIVWRSALGSTSDLASRRQRQWHCRCGRLLRRGKAILAAVQRRLHSKPAASLNSPASRALRSRVRWFFSSLRSPRFFCLVDGESRCHGSAELHRVALRWRVLVQCRLTLDPPVHGQTGCAKRI